MIWNPPFGSTVITLLVLLGLVVMGLSFLWSARDLRPGSPQGLIAIALRGVAFLLLLFFVLQPKRLPPPKEGKKQFTLGVMIDTSGSMSKKTANEAPTRLDQVRKMLADAKVLDRVGAAEAFVSLYSFDSQPSPVKPETLGSLTANGKQTDLGSSITKAVQQQTAANLAALLIFTDGRNNQGADPRAVAEKLRVPLFIVAVGEDSKPGEAVVATKDLAIDSVSADPRIITGRSAQVVVSVVGKGYPSRQVNVELLEDNKVISTSAVAISPQQTKRQALFSVSPTALGVHSYQVRINPEEGESDPTNNLGSFKVEVIDPVNRLVYIDRLRSERRFIKPMLETRKSLRYTAIAQQDASRVLADGNDAAMKKDAANFSPEQLAGVKAVILGDLPASAMKPEQIAALADWVDKGGALLLLAGPASMGEAGFVTTPLAKVLPVDLEANAKYIEQDFRVQLTPDGAAHPAFQKVKSKWDKAAPLLSRFEVRGVKPAATVLMATADTANAPVVVSHTYGHGRVAIVLTDTTFRWQLSAAGGSANAAGGASGGGGNEFAVFWRQLIDWLLPDMGETSTGASQVQLIADRVEYEVNEEVVVMASVRGADGAVVKDANVEIQVGTPDGRPIQRKATLDASAGGSGAYVARFEVPAAGPYEIQAVAKVGDQALGSDVITVRVVQPVIEFSQTDPDRLLLQEMAKKSGGQYLSPADLSRIVELARLTPQTIEEQSFEEKDAVPAWDRWWLGLILLGLMGGEWLVRKKNQWV